MNPREELKLRLIRERGWICEIPYPHECGGGIHMNEVFITRKMVMKAGPDAKRYAMQSPENIALCCGVGHLEYGHSRRFREYFKGVQEGRGYDVDKWLSEYPGKVK